MKASSPTGQSAALSKVQADPHGDVRARQPGAVG